MSNEAFDKFLLKLFEKTAVKDELTYFNMYEIGKEIGIYDESEINRIVKILHSDGFVANKKELDSEIRITDKGKKRLENKKRKEKDYGNPLKALPLGIITGILAGTTTYITTYHLHKFIRKAKLKK